MRFVHVLVLVICCLLGLFALFALWCWFVDLNFIICWFSVCVVQLLSGLIGSLGFG